jgi:hypothetical protein
VAHDRIGVTILDIEAPVVIRPVTSIKVEKTRSSLWGSSLWPFLLFAIDGVDP